MMLEHLGKAKEAANLYTALDRTVGSCKTHDLGGKATTEEFTDALIKNLKEV
jgi:isocitrate/isopropylmalate dehydrogenase